MRKIDLIFAILSGEGVAWLFYLLLKGQGIEIKFLIWILAISLPILALFGLWVCYLIGKKFLFIFQAAKFFLIGILATLVDLGVLNILMSATGIATGYGYSFFKGIAFIVATFAKYWGNKFWAFEKKETTRVGREMLQFYLVTAIGFGINVGVASFIVNFIGPQFGIIPKIWANIGAILAAFVAAIWNFLGYKFIVFKK
jgi:putative flippase GtrA